MSIIKYQKGNKFNPPPGWKPYNQRPLEEINPDTKSDTEKQTNRRLLEGADAQKNIVDLQLTFNNIVNGLLNLNPNAMLYSRPTQSQRNTEVQAQNKSSRLENFARTTLPTITNVMLAEVIGQGMQKLLPYVLKGIVKGEEKLQGVLNRLDNYIPASIDKLIKPKYDINIQGLNKMGIGNKQTIEGSFIKGMEPLKSGAESFVFKEGDNVLKVRRPDMKIDIGALKKELRQLNRTGSTPLHISGYYKHADGGLHPVLKQPYIKGTHPEYTEIQAHMQSQGWKADQDVFRKGNKVLFDTHPGNFIKDYHGKIHPIDLHILSKSNFAKYQALIPSLQLRSWKQGGLITYKK